MTTAKDERPRMRCKSICLRAVIVGVMVWALAGTAAAQQRMHTVFFDGTDHELHVYRIEGKTPGKTLMLIGGIQGDEPGGFLSADMYADMTLAKGNLIVVPRANFPSILLNRRQVNGDMNRRFAEQKDETYEDKIVRILKELIYESDCLLNLHDGSGFYSDKWESPERNPKRYGQSIIADCDVYTDPESGRILNLGEMGRQVSARINERIDDPLLHFHFNNHQTASQESLHKEQRKSATYYALYNCGIPAFGVETSKGLPLETKIRHHLWGINAFMEMLDIVPESPGVKLDDPEFDYLVIAVNDALPVVVNNGQTLYVMPGDRIVISHIEANYERGLSADVVGAGSINDLRKTITIKQPTRIVVRKDYEACGSINIALAEEDFIPPDVSVASAANGPALLLLKAKINGRKIICENRDTVRLVKGDILEFTDIMTNIQDASRIVVNFKGFVGNHDNNTGEDRGYPIDTGRDLWERYSLSNKGKVYSVVISHEEKPLGEVTVKLEDPVLNYLVFETPGGSRYCLRPGERLDAGSVPLRLVDVNTNISDNHNIRVLVNGSQKEKAWDGSPLTLEAADLGNGDSAGRPEEITLGIQRDRILLGTVHLNYQPEARDE